MSKHRSDASPLIMDQEQCAGMKEAERAQAAARAAASGHGEATGLGADGASDGHNPQELLDGGAAGK